MSNSIEYKININGNAVDQMKQLNAEMEKFNQGSGKNSSGGISNLTIGIGSAIAGMYALGNAAKATLDQFAKFEKARTVLTSTFGSKTIATKELNRLEEFASKTPFQLDSLTASYIKLVNQGFKPTNDQLTALGDLASATGKDFDMLSEALLDAQVGEFERLKEFGIKARVHGKNVAFSFKNITSEVENTPKAIQAYIISLGKLKSIQGQMANMSSIISGKESNLQDSFDKTKRIIGEKLAPEYNNLLNIAGSVLDKFNGINSLSTGSKLIQEKIELQKLAKEYMAKGTTTDRRKELLEQMGILSPELVVGVSDSAQGFITLSKNLKTVNDEYDRQIKGSASKTAQNNADKTISDKKQAVLTYYEKLYNEETSRLDDMKVGSKEYDKQFNKVIAINEESANFSNNGIIKGGSFINSKEIRGRADSYIVGEYINFVNKIFNPTVARTNQLNKKIGGKSKEELALEAAVKLKTEKGSDTLPAQSATDKTLVNASPSTFNVRIDNLVRVDKQTILTDEDEAQFNIKITNALLDAISTIKTQSRNA